MTLLALLAHRPMHGYEIRAELEMRRMDRWADIRFGSIYAGLRQLEKEDLIEEERTERRGRRPERTVYRITEAGREALRNLVLANLAEPHLAADPVDAALSFFPVVGVAALESALEERLERLDHSLRVLEAARSVSGSPVPGLNAMIRDLFDHSAGRLGEEVRWTRRVLERVRAGEYGDLDAANEETGGAKADGSDRSD